MSAAATQTPGTPPAQAPSPGWYPNPQGTGQRYWDGTQWTEQYSPPPPPPQAPPRRHRPWYRSPWPWLALIAGIALAAGAVVVVGGQQGTSDKTKAGQAADRSMRRLDSAMTRAFNRTNLVVAVPWACMSRATNINAYGGPALARCARGAERAAVTLRRMRRQLARTYRTSPVYVRRVYRPAYLSLRRVLTTHVGQVNSMAAYARVHGASPYVGAAEFEQIRTDQARAKAAEKRAIRLQDQARDRWKRYAERRWDLQYG